MSCLQCLDVSGAQALGLTNVGSRMEGFHPPDTTKHSLLCDGCLWRTWLLCRCHTSLVVTMRSLRPFRQRGTVWRPSSTGQQHPILFWNQPRCWDHPVAGTLPHLDGFLIHTGLGHIAIMFLFPTPRYCKGGGTDILAPLVPSLTLFPLQHFIWKYSTIEQHGRNIQILTT